MSNYIDTRDLYKRKCELESAKETLEEAQQVLKDAEQACDVHNAKFTPGDSDEGEAWQEESDTLENTRFEAKSDLDAALEAFGPDEEAELVELDELESEISDFMHGQTMVPETEFQDYARELAEDIGAIPDNAQWPCTCIDWEQAAKELAMDYSTVSYQGTDYYVRS